MKMPKLALREKRIIAFGGSALLLLVLVFYVISPFLEKREQLKKEVLVREAILIKNLQVISEKDDYLNKLDALNQRLEQSRTKLFDEGDALSTSRQLQQTLRDMAAQKGAEVTRLTPQREEKLGEDYVRIPVNMEIQCMPDQLVQFLLDVRNYQKRLLIDQVNIYTNAYTPRAQNQKERDLRIRPTLIISGIAKNVPQKKEEGERAKPPAKQKA